MQSDLVFLLKELDILEFIWHDETEGRSLSSDSCCSSDPVDILLDVAAEVPLDDPCHMFEVETSGGHIRANKD
jgi:hypothetical protein